MPLHNALKRVKYVMRIPLLKAQTSTSRTLVGDFKRRRILKNIQKSYVLIGFLAKIRYYYKFLESSIQFSNHLIISKFLFHDLHGLVGPVEGIADIFLGMSGGGTKSPAG